MDNKTYNSTEFKNLIIKAIGNAPKSHFAQRAGLSAQRIHNLLNDENNSVPRISTLKKLANASDNVSLIEYAKACGYTESDIYKVKKTVINNRAFLDDARRNDLAIRDLLAGITELAQRNAVYYSIEEFIDTFCDLYNEETYTFNMETRLKTYTSLSLVKNVYYYGVEATWETENTKNMVPFLILATPINDGKPGKERAVIYDAVFNPEGIAQIVTSYDHILKDTEGNLSTDEYIYIQMNKNPSNVFVKPSSEAESVFKEISRELKKRINGTLTNEAIYMLTANYIERYWMKDPDHRKKSAMQSAEYIIDNLS